MTRGGRGWPPYLRGSGGVPCPALVRCLDGMSGCWPSFRSFAWDETAVTLTPGKGVGGG